MKILSKALTLSRPFFYTKNTSHLPVLTILLLLLSACSTPSSTSIINTPPLPDEANPIQYTKYENIEQKLTYHLITVQLNNPSIIINASTPDSGENYEAIGKTTKDFATRQGAYFAINASPFSYPATRLSAKRNIEGLYIYEGKIISQPNENYAALCFTKDNKAFIINSQSLETTQEAYFAFGGFWTILENNTIPHFKDIKDSRTAVGISEDGFTAYILIVEKSAKSNGLNYMECAKILQNAGAYKAIQLDGGGSTSLVFPNAPNRSVVSSRKVANSIAFSLKK